HFQYSWLSMYYNICYVEDLHRCRLLFVYPFERVPVHRGASGEADNRIGLSMKAQLVRMRADRFVLHLEYTVIILILSLINRCGCKLSFRCEGQPDVHEYTCTNANEMSTQNADKSLISNAASIGGPIEVKHTIKHICGQF